jgi:hypothetical protein
MILGIVVNATTLDGATLLHLLQDSSNKKMRGRGRRIENPNKLLMPLLHLLLLMALDSIYMYILNFR